MQVKTVLGANGRPYEVYVGYTKGGAEVHFDKALADLTGDPEKHMVIEIRAHQEAEDEANV